MLDLQAAFQEIGGFGIFQVLVCITGSLTCCFAGSVISSGAFNNLIACSSRLNETDRTNDSSLATTLATERAGNASNRHGFRTSISLEYQLCNERASLGELSSVFLLAGCIPGSIVAGAAADALGRIPGAMIGLIGTVVTNVAATFAPFFWLHLASRMVCGFFISWTLGSIFVYGNEVLMTAHRSRFVKMYNLGPALGCVVLAYLAYQLRDYKQMMTANNFMAIPSALILVALPESPSWLMSQRSRHPDQVKAALRRIARINRCPPPSGVALDSLQLSEAEGARKQEPGRAVVSLESRRIGESLWDAIKSLVSDKKIIAQLLATCLYGFSSGFSYYGFTFVITHAVPNIYITVALMGAVEAFSLLLLNVLSRSQTLVISAVATATLCFSIGAIFAFVPAEHFSLGVSALMVGLAVGGRFVANLAFCAIVAVGAEIYPTAVRNTGLGLLMAALRTGCMLSPLVNFIPGMPARFATLGLACLLAAFPVRTLPDTRVRDLTTVEARTLQLEHAPQR